VTNGKEPIVDLSGLMADAEPFTIKVGDVTYTADPNAPAGLLEKVVAWCNGLLNADEEKADAESVKLVARAYSISEDQAAAMKPRLRRSMLSFFVTGPLIQPRETSS
jgi:hypothetical protein